MNTDQPRVLRVLVLSASICVHLWFASACAAQSFHKLDVTPSGTTQGQACFVEQGGVDEVCLEGPATLSGDAVFTLPAAPPSATEVVCSDSTGQLLFGCTGGGGGSTIPFADNLTLLEDDADSTKTMRFELGGFTTGTERVLTPQDADYTLAGTDLNNDFSVKQTFVAGLAANTGTNNISLDADGVLRIWKTDFAGLGGVIDLADTLGESFDVRLSQSSDGLRVQVGGSTDTKTAARFLSGGQLKLFFDPTDDTHVGDRGFNDGRYFELGQLETVTQKTIWEQSGNTAICIKCGVQSDAEIEIIADNAGIDIRFEDSFTQYFQAFINEGGTRLAQISEDVSGGGEFTARRGGVVSSGMATNAAQGGVVWVNDNFGTTIARLAADDNAFGGRVDVRDTSGNLQGVMNVNNTGHGQMVLQAADGTGTIIMEANENNVGDQFRVRNPSGADRVKIGVAGSGNHGTVGVLVGSGTGATMRGGTCTDGGFYVGSDRVVGCRQAAIADSTGTQADNERAINAALSALRTHGLISQ